MSWRTADHNVFPAERKETLFYMVGVVYACGLGLQGEHICRPTERYVAQLVISPVALSSAMMMDLPMRMTMGDSLVLCCKPHWMAMTDSGMTLLHNTCPPTAERTTALYTGFKRQEQGNKHLRRMVKKIRIWREMWDFIFSFQTVPHIRLFPCGGRVSLVHLVTARSTSSTESPSTSHNAKAGGATPRQRTQDKISTARHLFLKRPRDGSILLTYV